MARDFGFWLDATGGGLGDVQEALISRHLAERSRHRSPHKGDARALNRLPAVLREAKVIAPRPAPSLNPREVLLEAYHLHLERKWLLAPMSVTSHLWFIHPFLEETGIPTNADIVRLSGRVRCLGKGRKERYTPLTRQTRNAPQTWLNESGLRGSTKLFPNVHGSSPGANAVQRLLAKHVKIATQQCPSLHRKRITPHVLRHSAAMELIQASADCSEIALWLGHESTKTTQVYLRAHLALKEAALAKVAVRRTKGRALQAR